jgi:hypothetical protein
MRQTRLFLIFALLLVGIFSCHKETKPFNFTEKPYQPESVEQIKAKVAHLVAHTTSATAERDPYPNTEVNEALFDMEASTNFLYNANSAGKAIVDVQSYTFHIPNLTEQGELKMLGTAMSSSFATLISDVSSHASISNTVAVLGDFKIKNVTSTATHIEAKIAFESDVSGNLDWPVAAAQISNGVDATIQASLEPHGCLMWWPVVISYFEHVLGQNSNHPPLATATQAPSGATLYREQGNNSTFQYPAGQLTSDMSITLQICQGILANSNANSLPENRATHYKVMVLPHTWTPANNLWVKTTYVREAWARQGGSICY